MGTKDAFVGLNSIFKHTLTFLPSFKKMKVFRPGQTLDKGKTSTMNNHQTVWIFTWKTLKATVTACFTCLFRKNRSLQLVQAIIRNHKTPYMACQLHD